MDNSALQIYKAIGAIQSVISNATNLDDALHGCLKVIVDNAGADGAVIWYQDKAGGGALHPYFWISPVDLTRRSHEPGDGAVGRVFVSQKAERLFEFRADQDVETAMLAHPACIEPASGEEKYDFPTLINDYAVEKYDDLDWN